MAAALRFCSLDCEHYWHWIWNLDLVLDFPTGTSSILRQTALQPCNSASLLLLLVCLAHSNVLTFLVVFLARAANLLRAIPPFRLGH